MSTAVRQPADWAPLRSEVAVRRRPLRILASPWVERHFLYASYERLLDQLADRTRFNVVPLKDIPSTTDSDRVVVGLRHDVDDRLDNAIDMAALEAGRGLPATYFILHTAPYYGETRTGRATHRASLIPQLKDLQEQGHEIGWHNDLVTLQCVYGIEPREYLARELEWLRGHGIEVRGAAKHGSYWCHALRYDNIYFFADFAAEVDPDFPNNEVVLHDGQPHKLVKGRLEEFGLDYEAYHLGEDRYVSDARFNADGHRWHPDQLDLAELSPGEKLVISTHPDFWHASVATKTTQTVERAAPRALTGRRA